MRSMNIKSTGKSVLFIVLSVEYVISRFLVTAFETACSISAHHLVGDLVCFAAVYDDRTAVIFGAHIVVEWRLSLDTDRAAVDINVSVGIDAVGIALPHDDG